VMGVSERDQEVLDRACDLGLAFQLANIARDIDEDDAGGRCYLPMEWLAEMDIGPGQHDKPHNREKLAELAARLVGLMEQHEAAAKLGAARLRFRQRWAVLAAARIYGAIGRTVRERGALAWNQRVYTSAGAKAGHVLAAFVEALINHPEAPAQMPRWTRVELVAMARAGRPPKPEPMTPLPDEGIV
jgi:phytoene synthase